MKSKVLLGFAAVLSLVFSEGLIGLPPHKQTLCSEFLPKMNKIVPDYTELTPASQKGITKEQYFNIAERIYDEFAPDIESNRVKLKLITNWEDNKVKAVASKGRRLWTITVSGGFARLPGLTEAGFAVVFCHELGHFLGGAPRKTRLGKRKVTNEGQADYFATTKCMRRLYSETENQEFAKDLKMDSLAKDICDEVHYTNKNDQIHCYRSAIAALELAYIIKSLTQADTDEDYSYDTPDLSEVKKTLHSHPKAQCRMDTYFQGALCTKSAFDSFDVKDAKVGACNRQDNYTFGVRPLCWYRP